MSTEADNKFWDDHAAKLREFALLRPLTAEEAEEAARTAPAVPVDDEEIRRLVAAAAPCEPETPCEPDSGQDEDAGFGWLDEVDTAEVEEGVLQLNRNRGEDDGETDDTEDALRRRMLDDEEDEGGVEGGAGAPRPGGPGG
jgi:hypothetical protein